MSSKLEQAMQFVQSGNLASGQSLLAQVIREDPGNEIAWLWLANVLDDPLKKRQCLEKVLQLNPENEQAWRDLAQLETGVTALDQEAPSTKPGFPESQIEEIEPEPESIEAASVDETVSASTFTDEPVEQQAEPTSLDEFWVGLQSVKKEDEQSQVIPAGEEQGLGSFDDFLQSLKESGEYQGDNTWESEEPVFIDLQTSPGLVETEMEGNQPPEAIEEPGWAESDLSRSYAAPDHQDEIRPPTETESAWAARQVPQSKMSRSQTNIIILLAVITFLVFLVGLGYILWDILPTLR